MISQLMRWVAPGAMALGVFGCGGGSAAQRPDAPGPSVPVVGAARAIVFVSRREGDANIYRMRPDGSGQIALTSNSAGDFSPCLNRAGTELVWVSNRDGNDEIYKLRLSSGLVTRLTRDSDGASGSGGVADSAPIWSPDGTKIAWLSQRDQAGGSLAPKTAFVMDASGANQRRVSGRFARFISWGPDANRLAIVAGGASAGAFVYQQPIDGAAPAQGTRLGDEVRSFKWSPDGTRYLFSRLEGVVSGSFGFGVVNLKLLDIATGAESLAVPSGASNDYDAGFSPDGTRVVFQANESRGGMSGRPGRSQTGIAVGLLATPNAAPNAAPNATPLALTPLNGDSEPAWAE